MVNYAKNHNWSPYEKALIYGAYAHVVEDLFGHMITQPSLFGYGYSVLGDSADINGIGEEYEALYEVYTPSYIDDWSFIKTLYSAVIIHGQIDPDESYIDTSLIKDIVAIASISFDFMDFVMVDGQIGRWSHIHFTPVEKFVEAANAVGYAGSTLTQDRLEAYLKGWGIANFFLMGWEKDGNNQKNLGGIVGHLGTWSTDSALNFMNNIGDNYWEIRLVDG